METFVVNTHAKQEAIALFGRERVSEIEALVFIADPDMVIATLQGQDDEDGVSIVQMLYLNQD